LKGEKMKLIKIVLLGFLYSAVALVSFPKIARADNSCQDFFSDLNQWGKQSPQTHGYDLIGVSVMQPESNSRFASYFESGNSFFSRSQLTYFPSFTGLNTLYPARISGNVTEVFSDRRFDFSSGGFPLLNPYPFDPRQSQSGTITITLSPLEANSNVSFGLGFEFTPQCSNGFVYGFMPTNQGIRAYVLSIKKVMIPQVLR
jgi:hypothetical protein